MLLADITLEEWLTAAGIFVGAIVLAIVLGRVVNALLQRRTMSASLAIAFVSRLVRWTVILIGLVYAGGQVGVEIGPLIGALGITGLAAKDILPYTLRFMAAGAATCVLLTLLF